MKYLSIAAGLFAATTAVAETPVLTVYTYDSFVSDWGPGPAVKAAFEETCGCELNLVGAGDGAALLARVKLEGARSDADVVLGLDNNLTAAAVASGLFQEHGQTVTVDGFLVGNPEVAPTKFYMVQVVQREGSDKWAKTRRWTRMWERDNPDLKEALKAEKNRWFRIDPAVQAEIEANGWLGLGAEADAKFIEENY